jgi:hypothetical protein
MECMTSQAVRGDVVLTNAPRVDLDPSWHLEHCHPVESCPTCGHWSGAVGTLEPVTPRDAHPPRTAVATVAAAVVLVALVQVLFVPAMPDAWPSIAAALAIAFTTALTYTVVRDGPRSVLGLLRR